MSSENLTLMEYVRAAVDAAAIALKTAKAEDVPEILFPVREAWLEAVENGEIVDGVAIIDAIPPLSDPNADAAVDDFLSETWSEAIRVLPISVVFIDSKPVRALSGLRALAYEAGRTGVRSYDWEAEAQMAVGTFMKLSEGVPPPRYDAIMAALKRAFEDGRAAAGITDDPPIILHPVIAARIERAREAAKDRLANAKDLEKFADELGKEFKIHSSQSFFMVEEVVRSAASGGDLHAARLRRDYVLDTHRWFVAHVNEVEARGKLTLGLMIRRENSQFIIRQLES